MSSPNEQTLEMIKYRHTELGATLLYLTGFKGNLTTELMIDVVRAVFDKSRRTFRDHISSLRYKFPEIVNLTRVHLSRLGDSDRYLREIKPFDDSFAVDHAAIKNDAKKHLIEAIKDIMGIMGCYGEILD